MSTEVPQSTLFVPQISPECVSKVLKVFEDTYWGAAQILSVQYIKS